MKKTKLTRSLLAACSIVALSVVLSGCLHSSGDGPAETGGTMPTVDGNLTLAGVTGGMAVMPGTYTVDAALAAAFAEADGLADVEHAMGATVSVDGVDLTCATGPCTVTVNDNGTVTVTGTIHTADYMPEPTTPPDSDGDGVADADDAFPMDATETMDSDGDGVGDNADAFPMDAMESADSDGDGVGDNADAFPMDATETADSDGDGVGDNAQAEAERIAAATAAAATKATAIAAEAAQTTDAGLGGSAVTATGNADGAYNVVIEHGSTGIRVEGATDDDDEMFMDAMAGLDRGRTMLVREMDPDADGNIVREISIVATDIEAPTAVPFAMFEGRSADGTTVTTPQMLDARDLNETVDADGDGTPDNDFTARAVAQDAATYMLVSSSAFTAGTGAVLTFADDDTATAGMDEAFEAEGTYNGAPGTYRCNGAADCTVTLDAMGMITAMNDGWIFTPDAGATSDQPDYEFLHYGFWLQQTEDSDGAITYNEVETFFGASTALAASSGSDMDSLNGSASYSGGAIGVYVRDVYSEGGGVHESATSGHFSADVALTANFRGGSIPADDHDMFTGSITNFMLSGGEANDWAVNLEATRTGGENTVSGTANGGGAAGTFNAAFFGAVTVDDTTTDDVNESVYPSDVAGEFNANFSNGLVAGAFGANQDD